MSMLMEPDTFLTVEVRRCRLLDLSSNAPGDPEAGG